MINMPYSLLLAAAAAAFSGVVATTAGTPYPRGLLNPGEVQCHVAQKGFDLSTALISSVQCIQLPIGAHESLHWSTMTPSSCTW